jgi:hypothetical protein
MVQLRRNSLSSASLHMQPACLHCAALPAALAVCVMHMCRHVLLLSHSAHRPLTTKTINCWGALCQRPCVPFAPTDLCAVVNVCCIKHVLQVLQQHTTYHLEVAYIRAQHTTDRFEVYIRTTCIQHVQVAVGR